MDPFPVGRPYNCSPIDVNGKPCKDSLLSEQSASGLPHRSRSVIHQHGLWLELMKRGEKKRKLKVSRCFPIVPIILKFSSTVHELATRPPALPLPEPQRNPVACYTLEELIWSLGKGRKIIALQS